MSSYDHSTTVFSDEGRLLQVEYALKSVSTAPPILAVQHNNMTLVVSQKRIPSLFRQQRTEKLVRMSPHIYVAVSGVLADANVLVEDGRLWALDYLKQRNELIPVSALAEHMANVMQHATQHGGLRPYGLGGLLLGREGIFQIDPSGNVARWQAASVGRASGDVNAKIKALLKTGIASMDDLKRASVCALAKGLEKEEINENSLEMAVLEFTETECKLQYVDDNEVKEICAKVREEVDVEEDEQNDKR